MEPLPAAKLKLHACVFRGEWFSVMLRIQVLPAPAATL